MKIEPSGLRTLADILEKEDRHLAAGSIRDAADEWERLRAQNVGGNEGRDLAQLSAAATPGEWAFWPDHYAIKTATSFQNEQKVIAKTSCGNGAERSNGTFIVALVNAYRTGRLIIRDAASPADCRR